MKRALVLLSIMALPLLALSCKTQAAPYSSKEMEAAAGSVLEYAERLVVHGSAMKAKGEQLGDAHWVEDGLHLIDDGQEMKELGGQMLRTANSLAINPVTARRVDLDRAIADGEIIIREGQLLQRHAGFMVEHAEDLVERTQQPGHEEFRAEAEALMGLSQRMKELGQEVISAGEAHVELAQRIKRSIGARD